MQLPEIVEQLALRVAAQQRLMRMLSMNIEQPFANGTHLLQRHGHAVHKGARAACRFQDAANQNALARIERNLLLGKPGMKLRVFHRIELGAYFGTRRTETNQPCIRPLAQDKRQGVDQQ